ncbi:hypothetical protein [Methylobacterium oryzae]|uniref:hypothetical protein n=1 Tax=Methylobacterium oryzae TaxID=334852 RepID=UPI001F1FF7F5|nr:hypothetical protein [Methylobacterium oryzae]UIN36282.1 hypothetical protein LXM90_07220 [Methylobacterium oryzae]
MHAVYVCNGCGKDLREFFLHFSDDRNKVTKIGQFPPRTIKSNVDVEKLLGEHPEYLRRGQICEEQSYGIAAFAYYRRIVEEVIDELLAKVSGLIDPAELATYQEALDRVKTTRVAAEKIDLVKDMLPSILRPDGINPLRALHEALSEGLHSQTDEECLELAEIVRDSLVFLATQINISTAASANFTSGMKKLLEKKAARNASQEGAA